MSKKIGPILTMSGTFLATNTTYYSTPFYHPDADDVSYQVAYSDTPTFELHLETSNDPDADRALYTNNGDYTDGGDGRWFEENVSTISGADGTHATGSLMFHFDNLNSAYSRVRFDTTATGTVDFVRVVGKG